MDALSSGVVSPTDMSSSGSSRGTDTYMSILSMIGPESFLKWPEDLVVTRADLPETLRVALDAFGDALEPTLALRTPPRWADAAAGQPRSYRL